MLKKLSSYIEFNYQKEREGIPYYPAGQLTKNNDSFDFLHLIHHWSEIAGAKLSEHTIPLKNQNGTLIILSNHSAFAHEMKFMELPLKKKIFAKFPILEKSIKTIHFIVDSTHFENQISLYKLHSRDEKTELKMPHPFSPENKKLQKEASEMFSDIEDSELRQSLCTIYIQSKFNSTN